ncbi:CLUMA_CG009011, isoform A [Clunio marinus]|uniref:CLUMA_CG009011, isoform A n=1 Tax=Clunio marinus TaxID=568069 RepID=A0A1J1I724_9DIPT|nr:CLUMA_CG009011, isoform A [Clunio marinus]
MWRILFIFAFIAACESCRVIEQKANGIEVPRSMHTSQVLLEIFVTYDQKYLASGVLISPDFVLSTSRSLFGYLFINVHVYAYKLRDVFEDEREIYRSTNVTFHPDYDGNNFLNDVALIRLPVTLDVGNRPYSLATLPEASDLLLTGTEGKLVGWGMLDYKDDNAAEFKHEQTMTVLSDEYCRQAYPGKWNEMSTYEGRVCIVKPFGKNCVSDVGSPFFIDGVLYGLQSFGQNEACDEAYPNGIQEIRHHRDWILSNIA